MVSDEGRVSVDVICQTSTESRADGRASWGRMGGAVAGEGEECSLGGAQGLVTDTDTAVLILDTYLVQGGRRSSSRARERLAAMRLFFLFNGKSFFELL